MLMSELDGKIWMNGEFCDWKDAKIHILTHTLHYGTGVFEGVRAYKTNSGTAIFRLNDHTDRLFESARLIGMQIPFTKDELKQAQCDSVRINNLNNAYIRPICFYGSEGMGLRADNLKVHCCVAAWDWGTYLGEDKIKNGIKIKVSPFPKRNEMSMLYKAKVTGNYLNSMLALRDALNSGFDEALILDTDNSVNEGSGENFFIIKNNILSTPDLTTVLDGITRKTIISIAKDLGYSTVEKKISLDEVFEADEAFFTGTAAEVTPVIQVDNNNINNGLPGEITKKLQDTYFKLIRGNIKKNDSWLTLVDKNEK
ncbi:MAG: branched chain amino acid aminotransferase [Gammaproteobacteria bacterium]|nr:branched chain amino acid aminotransferase [Gammaproteobacteria bacterium]|tara:strand:+ start:150050 stop:150985 length:936 start_codon:yes stop_codon:yes gene_type:complete